MDTFGRHIVSDLWGCNVYKLTDKKHLENELMIAAEKSGATICGVFFHEFSPQGISGIVILAESHLSVHSFPEQGYASIDIYTCGRHVQPKLAIQYLYSSLEAKYNDCKAIIKSLEEGLGGYSVYIEATLIHKKEIPSKPNQIKSLSDRPIYYLNNNKDFLLQQIINNSRNNNTVKIYNELNTLNTNLDKVIKTLKTYDISIYFKELTTPDVFEAGFNVVRVIVPKLCYLPIGEPMIYCNRLKQKSLEYNREYNLEPHPFP